MATLYWARETTGAAAEIRRVAPSHAPIQCALLRDILGTPTFSPVPIDPLWRAWNDRATVRLAEETYETRAFDQLPLLADALEDVGCSDAGLLAHLRGPGPHARGCWALDAVLARRGE
jgi:hypothetical protein